MLRARAVAARLRSAALAARTLSTDEWSSATVCGVGNQAATLVATPALLPGDVPPPKRFSFTVDLPSEEGGRGTAASPPQHLIGALVGCLQAALHTTAAEGQVSAQPGSRRSTSPCGLLAGGWQSCTAAATAWCQGVGRAGCVDLAETGC